MSNFDICGCFSGKNGGLLVLKLVVNMVILVRLVLYPVHTEDIFFRFPITLFHNFYMIEVSQNNEDKIGFKLLELSNTKMFL